MEPPPSIQSVFSHKIAIFGHLETWIGAWNWQKKVTSSMVPCMRKVLVCSVQVLCIYEITATKNVMKRSKNEKKKKSYYGYF